MRKQVQPIFLPQGKVGWNKGEIISCIPQQYEVANDSYNLFKDVYENGLSDWQAQYIYITSDDVIADNNWMLDTRSGGIAKNVNNAIKSFNKEIRRIIASNDQKLIADGVPSVTDEFIRQYVECNGNCVVFAEMIDITPTLLDEKPIWKHRIKNDALVLTLEKQQIDIGQSVADRIQEKQSINIIRQEHLIELAEKMAKSEYEKGVINNLANNLKEDKCATALVWTALCYSARESKINEMLPLARIALEYVKQQDREAMNIIYKAAEYCRNNATSTQEKEIVSINDAAQRNPVRRTFGTPQEKLAFDSGYREGRKEATYTEEDMNTMFMGGYHFWSYPESPNYETLLDKIKQSKSQPGINTNVSAHKATQAIIQPETYTQEDMIGLLEWLLKNNFRKDEDICFRAYKGTGSHQFSPAELVGLYKIHLK